MALVGGAPVVRAAPSAGATAQPDDAEESERSKVRLHFELAGVGYQGNWTRQIYAQPAGVTLRSQRHGGELLAGAFNVVASRKGATTTFHTEHGRAGFFFGGTPRPSFDVAGAAKPVPRHGFNFGLFSDFRENAGVAVGGVCGFALSGIAGESVKAFTRSTLPGNHLEVDAGVAAGLQCAPKDTLVVVQYALEGNLGVEQMQDLTAQQGTGGYDPKQGNGLLLYGAHGPLVMLVRDSKLVHAALSAEYTRSIGDGRWGGRRWSVRAMLALAFGEKTAFGFAPWYRLDVINYGAASKVIDNNQRRGQTFGISFVAARARPSRR